MSIADDQLLRLVAPWVAMGFAATLLLGLWYDVRGALAAFGLGAAAPLLAYLPSADPASPFDLILGLLRSPVPFAFNGTGAAGVLLELTMDWWLGGAFGAALALVARRRSSS